MLASSSRKLESDSPRCENPRLSLFGKRSSTGSVTGSAMRMLERPALDRGGVGSPAARLAGGGPARDLALLCGWCAAHRPLMSDFGRLFDLKSKIQVS